MRSVVTQVELPAGGAISLCECGAANCSADASLSISGDSLVGSISKGGKLMETVDRALTTQLVGATAAGTNFTVLHRHGMWEFYLGGFLMLPERMSASHTCVEVQGSGGLRLEKGWEMTPMPPSTPVPTAPTWPRTA